MSEQVPQQPVDYLQEHPNAVHNQEQAYDMAVAGDPHESEAARLRLFATNQLQETIVKQPGKVRVIASITKNVIVPKINHERDYADQKYAEIELKPHDFAAEALKSLIATKR